MQSRKHACNGSIEMDVYSTSITSQCAYACQLLVCQALSLGIKIFTVLAELFRLPGQESDVVVSSLWDLPLPVVCRGASQFGRSCQFRQVGDGVDRVSVMIILGNLPEIFVPSIFRSTTLDGWSQEQLKVCAWSEMGHAV